LWFDDFQENNHKEVRKFLLGMNNLLLIAGLISTAGDQSAHLNARDALITGVMVELLVSGTEPYL
jgi:hypothetical protein